MITVAYYFLFLLCLGIAADGRHLGSTLGHPRSECRLLVGSEGHVRVGVVSSPLALGVQVVTAAKVREGRFRSMVHERLPMIFAREFRSASGRVDNDIVGVSRTPRAALGCSQRPSRLWMRGGSPELRLEVRAKRVSERSVPELLARLAEVK